MPQRELSTWWLHAFVGKGGNERKRYASKTFHGTKKDAGVALAAFITDSEEKSGVVVLSQSPFRRRSASGSTGDIMTHQRDTPLAISKAHR